MTLRRHRRHTLVHQPIQVEGSYHDRPQVVRIPEGLGLMEMWQYGKMGVGILGSTGYQSREGTMVTREMALCLALSGLTATAIAQPTSAPRDVGTHQSRRPLRHWPGHVHASEIAFQNGKSLSLVRGGQMLLSPGRRKRRQWLTLQGQSVG